MQVEYEFTENGPLQKNYPNLFNRICNLQEMIVSYFMRGRLFVLFPYGSCPTDVPRIIHVTFEERSAKEYERAVDDLVFRPLPYGKPALPAPEFSVTLELDLHCGRKGSCMFDFNTWNDRNALRDFCEDLKARCEQARRNMIG